MVTRAIILAACLFAAGCEQKMEDMPRLDVHQATAIFDDGAVARTPVPGTVATDADLAPVPQSIPVTVDHALLARGQERYAIYCAPCHGLAGDGDGMIVRHGFPAPPSFHSDALRQAQDRHFYDVITDGYGAMYSYAARVAPADRWAITAYIRALQLSHHAPASQLPDALRDALEEVPQ